MLFDLRSRKRRVAVKVIYIWLAVLMVVGLVGLGIGTGNTGGLLNAGGNGSGGSGNSANTAQVKAAIKAVNNHPSAANWAALMTARYSEAGSGNFYNSSTGAYTAAGKQQLQKAADAWQQYLKANGGNPSLNNALLAARVYQNLGQWTEATQAWNYAAQAAPPASRLKPYYCLALAAYSAKQTSKGDLAAAQAVALSPKLQRLTQKQALQQAKASPKTAQTALVQSC
jgi:hypothetical protein